MKKGVASGNNKDFKYCDPYTLRDDDPRKKKVSIMNQDALRRKIIDRLKAGGYYLPRKVESSGLQSVDDSREKEEHRVIKTIYDLEMTAHEVVRSNMSHIIQNLFA